MKRISDRQNRELGSIPSCALTKFCDSSFASLILFLNIAAGIPWCVAGVKHYTLKRNGVVIMKVNTKMTAGIGFAAASITLYWHSRDLG